MKYSSSGSVVMFKFTIVLLSFLIMGSMYSMCNLKISEEKVEGVLKDFYLLASKDSKFLKQYNMNLNDLMAEAELRKDQSGAFWHYGIWVIECREANKLQMHYSKSYGDDVVHMIIIKVLVIGDNYKIENWEIQELEILAQ